MTLSAVILAGGPSRRMGCDKARIALNGKTLLATQIERVRTLAPVELFISGNPETDYGEPRYPVLHDAVPEGGPLAGILAALLRSSTSHLLVLAVDLPLMNARVLAGLVNPCTDATGVVPRVGSRVEPLAAVYPTETAHIAERMLRQRLRSVRAFAENCLRRGWVRFLPVGEADGTCFGPCRYPEDLPEGAFCACASAGPSRSPRRTREA